ncbi:MAG: DNA-3-methyladenine glycosylase [Bacteroidetes bacterium]|nr:DNA-3-methyladenine glycosylase [Bacteroidota bacterium]
MTILPRSFYLRTVRTEIMYAVGGTAYIYLCYGIHSLFNIVTNELYIPHAILIMGIIPEDGIRIMLERVGKSTLSANTGIGPGKVAKLLGIHFSLTRVDLTRKADSNQFGIWLEDRGLEIPVENILQGPRIGVNYAGEDSQLSYRFWLKDKS